MTWKLWVGAYIDNYQNCDARLLAKQWWRVPQIDLNTLMFLDSSFRFLEFKVSGSTNFWAAVLSASYYYYYHKLFTGVFLQLLLVVELMSLLPLLLLLAMLMLLPSTFLSPSSELTVVRRACSNRNSDRFGESTAKISLAKSCSLPCPNLLNI